MEHTHRHTSFIGPLILIGLGILFLLQNFGIVTVDVWNIIWRFWPVFLIAAGLDMLFGRRSNAGVLIGIVVLAIVLVFGWQSLRIVGQNGNVARGTGDAQTIQQPLEGIERAVIDIETGLSQVTIQSATEGRNLVEGTVIPHRNERVRTRFNQEGDVGYLRIDSQSSGPFSFMGLGSSESRWDLRLHSGIPLQLSVDTGAGNTVLNLARLNLTELRLNAGVGSTTTTLPGRGHFMVDIDGGVGGITVLIPDTLAAHITVDTGIGSVDVDEAFAHRGDAYVSSDFEAADDQVTLTVNGGVGSIEIRQIAQR